MYINAYTLYCSFGHYTVKKCTFTFQTTNVFVCSCDLMTQFKIVKHKFPN